VTDDAVLAAQDFLERAVALVDALGASIALHLRARSADGRMLFDYAQRLARESPMIFVNDRVDVARLVPRVGVQLRHDSLPIATARAWLGDERWLGCSVHEAEAARRAAEAGADFVIAGTIFESASHPGAAPRGIEHLARIVRETSVRRELR
jgi:thiamine-phosphate pyrophosphorylase